MAGADTVPTTANDGGGAAWKRQRRTEVDERTRAPETDSADRSGLVVGSF
jgi:hypothetical protein